MGEVYKAIDTRLDRTVALKVLPTHSIPTDDARRRFEREARAVSQLSHPHICALFDVGREGETDFLVMELVDGETLQSRLGLGPLPLADVLRYGAQIADALDRAHRSGIAHRDLKPGNVMVTKSGVKLLDFGLARAIAPVFPGGGASELKTATAHEPVTHEGAIVGTLQYMAPEQVEGKAADARSDVFALGCVLYEMATGRRAFEGSSAAAVASSILRADIAPLTTLRADAPPALGDVVRNCMIKDPDERWQSAHDVKLVLEGLKAGAPASHRPRRGESRSVAGVGRRRCGDGCGGGDAAARAAAGQPSSPSASRSRPRGTRFAGWSEATTFALSPDGGTLAFVATDAKGRRVYLRGLSSLEAKPLEGTEGVQSAFWSPDGKAIAFFTENKLKRLDLGSGAPVPICDVRPGAGLTGTWGADGQILFSSIEGDGIFRVQSEGGAPEKLQERDAATGVQRVKWPSFLPDGKRYLYLIRTADRSLPHHARRARPARARGARSRFLRALRGAGLPGFRTRGHAPGATLRRGSRAGVGRADRRRGASGLVLDRGLGLFRRLAERRPRLCLGLPTGRASRGSTAPATSSPSRAPPRCSGFASRPTAGARSSTARTRVPGPSTSGRSTSFAASRRVSPPTPTPSPSACCCPTAGSSTRSRARRRRSSSASTSRPARLAS